MTIRQVQAIPGRNGLPTACLVLTMVDKRFRLIREIHEAAASFGFPVANAMHRQRQVDAHALGEAK